MLRSYWKIHQICGRKQSKALNFYTENSLTALGLQWKSTDMLYIHMLSVQMYSTTIPHLSEQWTDLKPWDDVRPVEAGIFSGQHDLEEKVSGVCREGITS